MVVAEAMVLDVVAGMATMVWAMIALMVYPSEMAWVASTFDSSTMSVWIGCSGENSSSMMVEIMPCFWLEFSSCMDMGRSISVELSTSMLMGCSL